MPTQVPKNWQIQDEMLVREFEFKNFLEALQFVNEVAKQAETLQHHPDILIHSYRRVNISTTTHDAGKVTDKDYRLAELINQI